MSTEQEAIVSATCPVRETAMHVTKIARASGFPVAGIDAPDRLPGAWIDRRDLAERRDGIKDAFHHERRVGVSARPRRRVCLDQCVVRRRPSPRNCQLADVVLVDLIERGILMARGVATVMRPLSF